MEVIWGETKGGFEILLAIWKFNLLASSVLSIRVRVQVVSNGAVGRRAVPRIGTLINRMERHVQD